MDSLWGQTCAIPPREPLPGPVTAEAAVIGAGMAGILTAWMLQEAGHQVVVLEADRIAGGQTRNTTAKITSQHGLCYARLLRTLGPEKAALYAGASQAAVERFRALVEKKGIDCGFQERDAYVYGADAKALREEAAAAASLGLPASYVESVSLPIPTAGAVRFTGQAQFHPLQFLKALAAELTIYEATAVRRVRGNRIETDRGTVLAEKIVFACHFPFVNFPGLYFARMHQERSYVLALQGAPTLDGMYLGADKGGVSLRSYGDLLLLGGGGHRTGQGPGGGRYDLLRALAGTWFPGSREAGRWSAQDCMTLDGAPYIGRFAAGRPDWYVATGFGKWGMTGSMVSAELLRALADGEEAPALAVFHPGRFSLRDLPALAREGVQSARGLGRELFHVPPETVSQLPPGHGGIVLARGKKAGAYREEDGTLHLVEARCPHLGCQLEWNPDERSWDCPCHGSRFDLDGRRISGPAQEDIRWKRRGGA